MIFSRSLTMPVDAIGYFPQMIITGICAVVLLFITAKREIEAAREARQQVTFQETTPIVCDVEKAPRPTKLSVDFSALPKHFRSLSQMASHGPYTGGRKAPFRLGHSRQRKSFQVDARFIIGEDE